MTDTARQGVGIAVMVLGVALLIATALVDLPGLGHGRSGRVARTAAALCAASFAAIVGGAWLSAQAS